MTDGGLAGALAESTAEVLEKMFFVRATEESVPASGDVDGDLNCEVSFSGNPSGRLVLRVGLGAAHSMAADFLGDDEGALSEVRVSQVVCELANMICGSVLSRIESGTTFRLESPRLLSAWEASGPHTVTHSVVLGGGILTVEFSTERPVCPMSV